MNYYDQFYTVDYYFQQKEKFSKGEISLEDWSLYCTIYLNRIMSTNNAILERLESK